MDMSLMFAAISTAIMVGLGCGSCCSPFISLFLSSYIVSHGNGIKSGLSSLLVFFIGKVTGITVLCVTASLIGKQFISEDGYIGTINMRLLGQIIISILGIILIIRWFIRQKKRAGCAECSHCGKDKQKKTDVFSVFLTGISYGITPCAPLIMMIGYSAALPVSISVVTGVTFGTASIAGPIIMLALISGVLSKKLLKELPEMLQLFQLAAYGIMIILPFVIGVGE